MSLTDTTTALLFWCRRRDGQDSPPLHPYYEQSLTLSALAYHPSFCAIGQRLLSFGSMALPYRPTSALPRRRLFADVKCQGRARHGQEARAPGVAPATRRLKGGGGLVESPSLEEFLKSNGGLSLSLNLSTLSYNWSRIIYYGTYVS